MSEVAAVEKKSTKDYLKGWVPFRIMRYWFFGLVTAFALIAPWISINGNHLFLLSFDKLKLHLAFVQFDMQEMYLMPFVLMILFIGIFGLTVVGGRVFCGWMCPQTIFRVLYRDLIETKLLKLRKRIKNKQNEPDMSKPENQVKKLIAVLLWTVLSLVAAADFMWFFVPPEDFFAYLANPMDHLVLVGSVLIIAGFLVVDVVMIKENFCVYVCPYSRIQSVLYDDDTVMAIYDPHRGGKIYDEHTKLYTKEKDIRAVEPESECTACESCVTVCPTHIDIRQGLQLECINCLECVDACTAVMGKLGKESLVRWSSDKEVLYREGKTSYFRPKVIGYAVVLLIVMGVLAAMSTTKEHMLLNINKESRLYDVKTVENGVKRVGNAYVFLLQNTENKDHDYYFDVIPPAEFEGKIKILKPTAPFKASPGAKKKKVVVLYTDELLVDDATKDTIIPITIRAYALDEKERIVVDRHSTFIFPRKDIYDAH